MGRGRRGSTQRTTRVHFRCPTCRAPTAAVGHSRLHRPWSASSNAVRRRRRLRLRLGRGGCRYELRAEQPGQQRAHVKAEQAGPRQPACSAVQGRAHEQGRGGVGQERTRRREAHKAGAANCKAVGVVRGVGCWGAC